MPKPKGGRGKAAPYTTRQVRVPEPLIAQVDTLIEQYQEYIASGGDVMNPPKFLDTTPKPVDNFRNNSEIVNILQEALKLKANAGGKIKERIREAIDIISKFSN